MVAKFLHGWCAVGEDSGLLAGFVVDYSYAVGDDPVVLEISARINWSVSLF